MVLLTRSKHIITEGVIKDIHRVLMDGILHNTGNYRNYPMRMIGSQVATVNYISIQNEMKN